MDDHISIEIDCVEVLGIKIGILSMQRVVNYGSFLQAYALQGMLRNMGHECHFIDIKPNSQVKDVVTQTNRVSKIAFIAKRLDRYFFYRIKHLYFIKKRIDRFNNDFFPRLGLSKEPNYFSHYDAIVIGSDEVFNCTQNVPWGFAKTLFGEGLDSDNIITYAASCGHTTLEKLEQYGIKDEVQKAMSNFKAISVRDANTKKFAEELTGGKIHEHIDPTLIYDYGELEPASVPEKNYLLIYAYDGRISDKETIAKIKEFAKNEKKKLICAGVYQSWCDKNILCTPFEMLAYFRNADYIVTDTFHGTVFSIKFNKQFATIIRVSNSEKLHDLLDRFLLLNKEVQNVQNLGGILKEPIDYQKINFTINEHKRSAIEYLQKYIGFG